MKCQSLTIKNNIPKVEKDKKNSKSYVTRYSNTVVYYKTVNSAKNYRKRLSDSMIKEITSMEDYYSQKD